MKSLTDARKYHIGRQVAAELRERDRAIEVQRALDRGRGILPRDELEEAPEGCERCNQNPVTPNTELCLSCHIDLFLEEMPCRLY